MPKAVVSDAKVDALFRSLPESYRPIADALRRTIRHTAPGLRETVKWNNPFWVGSRDVLCLMCYPDHVNLGFLRGAELAERFPRIEGTGKSMRHVKVANPRDAGSADVVKMVRAAVELDRKGR